MLQDSRTRTPDTEMVENDDLRQVMCLLDKMDPREATVLRMRFGLNDEEPKTLKEIGESLGLTRERVRQIESEALQKLSECLSAEWEVWKGERSGVSRPIMARSGGSRRSARLGSQSANAISNTLNRIVPRGTSISATSPRFLPRSP